MKILIETHGDGHREIVVDGKRFIVDKYESFSFSTVGETMDRLPVRAFSYQCREFGADHSEDMLDMVEHNGPNNRLAANKQALK